MPSDRGRFHLPRIDTFDSGAEDFGDICTAVHAERDYTAVNGFTSMWQVRQDKVDDPDLHEQRSAAKRLDIDLRDPAKSGYRRDPGERDGLLLFHSARFIMQTKMGIGRLEAKSMAFELKKIGVGIKTVSPRRH